MSLCTRCRGELTATRAPLGQRQRQMYDWIAEFIQLNQFAPTYREIADAFGFHSLATVAEHLDALERKGWITRTHNTKRNIEIVELPSAAVSQ